MYGPSRSCDRSRMLKPSCLQSRRNFGSLAAILAPLREILYIDSSSSRVHPAQNLFTHETNKTMTEAGLVPPAMQAAPDETAAKTISQVAGKPMRMSFSTYSLVLDLLSRPRSTISFSTYCTDLPSPIFQHKALPPDGDPTGSSEAGRRASNREWLVVRRRQRVSSGSSAAHYQERRWGSKTGLW